MKAIQRKDLLEAGSKIPAVRIRDQKKINMLIGKPLKCLQDDYGNTIVCLDSGEEMYIVNSIDLDFIDNDKTNLVIVLDGGLIQEVLSSKDNVTVSIVDYDAEGAEESELSQIPQERGKLSDAVCRHDSIEVDAERVSEIIKAIN